MILEVRILKGLEGDFSEVFILVGLGEISVPTGNVVSG